MCISATCATCHSNSIYSSLCDLGIVDDISTFTLTLLFEQGIDTIVSDAATVEVLCTPSTSVGREEETKLYRQYTPGHKMYINMNSCRLNQRDKSSLPQIYKNSPRYLNFTIAL